MDRHVRQGLRLTAALAFLAAACASGEGPPPAEQAPSAPAPPASAMSADPSVGRVRPFHLLTIAHCSREGSECSRAQATAPPGPTYVVAVGAAAGSTRSREQAMADLYRELRDRTAYGSHLVARPRHLGEGEGGAPVADDSNEKTGKSVEGDPLVEAAFALMKIVDREGEVTIDRAPSNGLCKVALGELETLDASAGVNRCFLSEERHQGPPVHGRGIAW